MNSEIIYLNASWLLLFCLSSLFNNNISAEALMENLHSNTHSSVNCDTIPPDINRHILPLDTNLMRGNGFTRGATQLQFDKLWAKAIAAQQKSGREQLQIQGKSETQEFEVFADQYDENRHFFLSQYNRNAFEGSLRNLPQIRSQFLIHRMDVWISNERNVKESELRDIVALSDLGEGVSTDLHNSTTIKIPLKPNAPDLHGEAMPDNESNDLYTRILASSSGHTVDKTVSILRGSSFQMTRAKDYERVSARLLNKSEYSFHPELGFLSLNVELEPDQVLGVSYQYTYKGKVFTVGELTNISPASTDTQEVHFVKLLKSSEQRVDFATWDLMMKNIYNIGAYQVGREDFKLEVFYEDPGYGDKRFLPEGNLEATPLIQVFNLDNLNAQGDPLRDGVFDFVSGLTINTQTGRLMFPLLEPFGSSLARQMNDHRSRERFVYQQLYDSTLTSAREFAEYNRFRIAGTFKSSVSSVISLGAFNVPKGSVIVKARGELLKEDIDYEVDYNIGRIKILDETILNSGTPIDVSFEPSSLFDNGKGKD